MNIIHNHANNVIEYEELIKKPSSVFKQIIGIIEAG